MYIRRFNFYFCVSIYHPNLHKNKNSFCLTKWLIFYVFNQFYSFGIQHFVYFLLIYVIINIQIILINLDCIYHNDKLIGYILYKSLYNFINIDNLGVIYEYRNKGIGTLLIKFLINLAKKNKMNIRLQVRISNIIAINLYSKLGFKKKYILKNYYSNEDGWLMECL